MKSLDTSTLLTQALLASRLPAVLARIKIFGMRHVALLGLAATCCLSQTGCVTGRRVVELPVASVPAPTGASKGELALGTVTDNRMFENKPKSPSTPSVDGKIESLSREELATFIGRQRNGYGKAMGDITLPANDSVVKRARALIEEGIKRRGFTVTNTPANGGKSVTVAINEFWAWFSPGAFSVTFEGRIICTLTVTQGDSTKTLVVAGHGKNSGQVASDANWALAYKRTFEDFLINLQQEMEKAGL